jgi:hypothetical protein
LAPVPPPPTRPRPPLPPGRVEPFPLPVVVDPGPVVADPTPVLGVAEVGDTVVEVELW